MMERELLEEGKSELDLERLVRFFFFTNMDEKKEQIIFHTAARVIFMKHKSDHYIPLRKALHR